MRNFMVRAALASGLLVGFQGCVAGVARPQEVGLTESTYSMAEFAALPKIDAHVHANLYDPAFIDIARRNGFSVFSINVDYPDFPALSVQSEVADRYFRGAPDSFSYATTFSMVGFGTKGWAEATIAGIERDLDRGAIGVKVWKNIGMVERDRNGELIMLDDPGFDPVMAYVKRRNAVLVAHQAEPHNCWLPLEQMTTENDRLYFAAHPEYHMYLHPEMPSYQALLAARDRFVAKHPDLSVIGAHMGSIEWNVDDLAAFLDRHPNAVVDMAARMSNLQYQSNRDHRRVRDFLIKYQDRILYATDLTLNPPSDEAKSQNPPIDPAISFSQAAEEVWRSDWRYLATRESQYVATLKADTPGLGLPRSVIRKIYYENARRTLRR